MNNFFLQFHKTITNHGNHFGIPLEAPLQDELDDLYLIVKQEILETINNPTTYSNDRRGDGNEILTYLHFLYDNTQINYYREVGVVADLDPNAHEFYELKINIVLKYFAPLNELNLNYIRYQSTGFRSPEVALRKLQNLFDTDRVEVYKYDPMLNITNQDFDIDIRFGLYAHVNYFQDEIEFDFPNTHHSEDDESEEEGNGLEGIKGILKNYFERKNPYFQNIKGSIKAISFAKGKKNYYILSPKTYENCIFVTINHYLLFLNGKTTALLMTNHELCEKGKKLKQCIERYVRKKKITIDWNDMNEVIEMILEYLCIRKDINIFIYVHNLKFSIVRIFKNTKNREDISIHLRVYNKHAQLIIPKDELTPELENIIRDHHNLYQLTDVLEKEVVKKNELGEDETEKVVLTKDPVRNMYYYQNLEFKSQLDFESYCFENNIDIFDSGNLKIDVKRDYQKLKTKTMQQVCIDNNSRVNNFGVYDIESEELSNGTQVAVKILVMLNYDYKKIFTGKDCLEQFTNELRENKQLYDQCSLWALNGRNYDMFLLMKNFVENKNVEIMCKTILIVDNGLLKTSIRLKSSENTFHQVHFRDPSTIFQGSLFNIGKSLDCKYIKMKDIDIQLFMKLWKFDKNIEQIVDEYLTMDGFALYNIMEKLYETFRGFDIDINKQLTIPSIAIEIFMNKFMNNTMKLPRLKPVYERIIRGSYFGGHVETFTMGRVAGAYNSNFDYSAFNSTTIDYQNLWKKFMLDFNSLYPDIMLLPLPCGKYDYVKQQDLFREGLIYYNEERKRIFLSEKASGYFHVRYRGKKCLHPVKVNGKLMFPQFDQWTELTVLAESVKYNQKHEGEEYEILEAIRFDVGEILKAYILYFWKMRKQATKDKKKALSAVIKLLMNSLYGYLGMTREKMCVKVMHSKNKHGEMFESLWKADVLNDIVTHGDYVFFEIQDNIKGKLEAVYLSSAITELARLKLFKAMEMLKGLGCRILYTDTDSLIIECKNPEEVLLKGEFKETFMKDQDELGMFKDEFAKMAKEKLSKECFEKVSIQQQLFEIQELKLGGNKQYSAISFVKDNDQIVKLEKTSVKGLRREGDIHLSDLEKIMSEEGLLVKGLVKFSSKRPSIFRSKDLNLEDELEQDELESVPYEDLGLTVKVTSDTEKLFRMQYEKGHWKQSLTFDDYKDSRRWEVVPYFISELNLKENHCNQKEWEFIRRKLS